MGQCSRSGRGNRREKTALWEGGDFLGWQRQLLPAFSSHPLSLAHPGIRTLPTVGAEPWRPYLLQAASERGPLHIPGGLVTGILLLQPPPCTFVLPQLHTQLLQQRLERAEQRLVLCHLQGHRAALPSHKGEDRRLASKGALVPGCLQGGWEGICTVSGRAGSTDRLQDLGLTLPRAHWIRMLAPQEPGAETGGSCGRPGGAKPGLPGHSA